MEMFSCECVHNKIAYEINAVRARVRAPAFAFAKVQKICLDGTSHEKLECKHTFDVYKRAISNEFVHCSMFGGFGVIITHTQLNAIATAKNWLLEWWPCSQRRMSSTISWVKLFQLCCFHSLDYSFYLFRSFFRHRIVGMVFGIAVNGIKCHSCVLSSSVKHFDACFCC